MKEKVRYTAFVPLILLLAAAYFFPLVSDIAASLRNEQGEFAGLQNYAEVLSSYYFLDSLAFTLRIALLSTLAALVLALIAAMALRRSFAGKKLTLFFFQYNLGIPHMVCAMMTVMLLSRTGLVSTLAFRLGLTDSAADFPLLVRDSRGLGIALTFIWKYFPYIALSALGVLESVSPEYEMQAACLGVGKSGRFFHVTLPQLLPTLSAAAAVVFAAAFGEYEIPAILSSPSHRTLSVMLYIKYCDLSQRNLPHAYALMVLMSLVLMCFVVCVCLLTGRGRRRK